MNTENKAAALVKALKEQGAAITGAESLTGGLVAAEITSVPGASAVFPGSFVTYCDGMKASALGVPAGILEKTGAISAETAAAMAEGAAKRAGACMGYATTGNAGPDAQEGKPVGMVFTAVSYRGKTRTYEHKFSGGRASIREQTAEAVLGECLEALEQQS